MVLQLFVKPGDKVKKGDIICKWDPYNAVIIAESAGKVEYEDIDPRGFFPIGNR